MGIEDLMPMPVHPHALVHHLAGARHAWCRDVRHGYRIRRH
jgi:hypothetical protein